MMNKTQISLAVQACIINTGDYIDPTPWSPEDHERFKKAMDRVHELKSLEIKSEIQKSISAGAGVIYVENHFTPSKDNIDAVAKFANLNAETDNEWIEV